MRLIYLSNARIPGRDAATIQQMQMAEAFANVGLDVTFIRPFYFELAKYSHDYIFSYYGIESNFRLKALPSLLSISKPAHGIDTGFSDMGMRKGKIPKIGGASMMISTWFYIQKQLLTGRFNRPTIVYCRNLNAATVFLHQRERWFSGKPVKVFVEAHALVQKPAHFFEYILHNCDGIISITNSLKEKIVGKYNIPPEKFFVAPDGVRTRRLTEKSLTQQEARQQLAIPAKYQKVVLYTGALSPGKGVEVFIRAASEFDEKVIFYIVGGTPKTIEEVKAITGSDRLSNVHFAGFVPPKDVATYQQAADVLVLPNTADYKLKDYTSPLKLFEYMATRRPIVASDLPVFREILTHEKNSVLVAPGDPKALAGGIRRVLADGAFAQRISRAARNDVEKYSWDSRAKNIVRFIKKRAGWENSALAEKQVVEQGGKINSKGEQL